MFSNEQIDTPALPLHPLHTFVTGVITAKVIAGQTAADLFLTGSQIAASPACNSGGRESGQQADGRGRKLCRAECRPTNEGVSAASEYSGVLRQQTTSVCSVGFSRRNTDSLLGYFFIVGCAAPSSFILKIFSHLLQWFGVKLFQRYPIR